MLFNKTIIIIFFPLVALTQNKMDGLGPFKIGKTLKSDISNSTEAAYSIFTEISKADDIDVDLRADYFVLAGITIHDLQLIFFNDTLYSILCDASDSFVLALKTKYGNGIIQPHPKDDGKCTLGSFSEHSYMITYPTTDYAIEASLMTGYFFDTECKKHRRGIFQITNMVTYSRMQNKKHQEFKEKLKEF